MSLFADLLGAYWTPAGVRVPTTESTWTPPPWLQLSWENPKQFFAAVLTEGELALGGPAKSRADTGIDFYADAVLRHLHREPGSPVLRWYTQAEGWQSLSRRQIDAQAGALASVLVAKGVGKGARVALVLPAGAPLLVGILAGLHVGCTVLPVLPCGSTYVQSLLTAAEPEHVITCSPYTALRGLLDRRPVVLSRELLAQAGARPPTATYAPDASVFLIPSPLRTPGALVELTAAASYFSALRDGLLIFGLRPGDLLAAPPTPQYLPATPLAALLCGAGLTEISGEAMRADAAPLLTTPHRAVVLTRSVREALTEAAAGPIAWGSWFRDPQEGFDIAGWERAERRLRLSAVPHANLQWDAASGGAVLVSALRRGPPHPYMMPAAGLRHRLGAPDAEGEAVTDVGQLVLLGEDLEPVGSPGEALLLRTESGYMYGGTGTPRRAGWAYPSRDVLSVLQAAKELPACVGASIVELMGAAPFGHGFFVLVLFTGEQPRESIVPEVCLALIERELGPAGRPDRVEVFPLYPRRQGGTPEGEVDTGWVDEQYVNGALHKKAKSPLHRALTRVRGALLTATKP